MVSEPVAVTPRFERAVAASDAPVPPSATAKSVIPLIEPPVIEIAFEFWVATLPKPRLVLAEDALAKSDKLLARNAYVASAPVAITPRFVRASAAVEAPVPPSATAKSVLNVKV